jgi:hypothetical protein
MTQAQDIFQLALRLRELASETELPDYIEKLFQAAEDLEWRAIEVEAEALAA